MPISLSSNLALGSTFIEGFMVDYCTITRDKAQQYDDTLNLTTGVLTSPGTQTAVYTGKCLVKTPKTPDQMTEPARQPLVINQYKILLPRSATTIRLKDSLSLTISKDPDLLDHVFRVVDVTASTLSTYKALWVEDVTNLGTLYVED